MFSILGIIGTLGGLLPTALSLTQQIVDWQAKKINAVTEHERIEADEHVKMLQAKRDVLIAEGNSPWNSLARAWLMLPPSVYIAKIFVWDKVLGKGDTDPLTTELWWLVMLVYGFYFVADISRMLKR